MIAEMEIIGLATDVKELVPVVGPMAMGREYRRFVNMGLQAALYCPEWFGEVY